MITKPFREAMTAAISRLISPDTMEKKYPWLSDALLQAEQEGASMEALLPVCWIIEYNETDAVFPKSAKDTAALLNIKTAKSLKESFPVLYQALHSEKKESPVASPKEETGAKNTFDNIAYQVFIKYFKNSDFDGRSIVRIGLGLQMTVDEINLVLLSYGKQTISWHRVDDLLFRYAAEKRWTYTRFHKVYNDYLHYRAFMEAAETAGPAPENPTLSAQEAKHKRDSAYMTQFNRQKLKELILSTGEPDDREIYVRLHAYFIDTERMASGAPRRTLMKICRWAHSGFSLNYATALLEQKESEGMVFGACPEGRALTAYQMLMEAAGDPPGFSISPKAADACAVVNRVIGAINDLGSKFKTAVHPPYPQGIDYMGGRPYFDVLAQWRLDMVLSPETQKDSQTLTLIAECLCRDLPQEYQALQELNGISGGVKAVHTETILKAAGIALHRGEEENPQRFESALRQGVFHLLLCCCSSRARRMMHITVRDALQCLGWSEWNGNLPQDTAAQLISQLREMPAGEDGSGLSLCSGQLQKEVKSFIAQADTTDQRKTLFSHFSALSHEDRQHWMTDFLDAKCIEALARLSYTPEQKTLMMDQWHQLDIDEKTYYLTTVLRRQYLTERDVQDPLSFTFAIAQNKKESEGSREEKAEWDEKAKQGRVYLNLGKRTSEPSRNLILFMALVFFGAVAENDVRSFTMPSCEKYIGDCIKNAWGVGWRLSQTDDELDSTVETIIQEALTRFSSLNSRRIGETLFSLWKKGLQAACEQYRSRCRDQEIEYLTRFNRFGKKSRHLLICRNSLFNAALMAGQWKYDREKKKA